jgi:DNA polymerase
MTLDARQKAMLREMGVRVWWPTQAAPAEGEPEQALAEAKPAPQAKPSAAPAEEAAGLNNRASPQPMALKPASSAQAMPTAEPEGAAQGWRVGALQALHEAGDSGGPRWLLLMEQRQDSSGDAQRLLQAMLRAARLHQGSQVWLAPLLRVPETGAVQGLEPVLEGSQPDLVFIMGRLGAQALLETDEPLGRLRGQVHDLWGLPAVVSYDPVTLLRSPADKGKAWDDLCLAGQLAHEQYAERKASEAD